MVKEELIREVLGKEAYIVEPLRGGMMNESYIVVCDDKKYVLYIPTDQANEMVNRYLEKETQAIVYRLKLTSKNVYFDTETGIKINEYIEGYSLNHVDKPNVNRVAGLLKYLHNNPTMSTTDYYPFRRLEGFEGQAKKYRRNIPEEYTKLREFLYKYKDYLESQELCLCHNDSQKSNIVVDVNTNKYYLIDFEFAANNDPIYDIAAYGNGEVKDGRELLDAYYLEPTMDEIKRFYLWRIFISLQWHNVAIIKHYRKEGLKHNYNFLKVASFFLENAKEAYKMMKKEVK